MEKWVSFIKIIGVYVLILGLGIGISPTCIGLGIYAGALVLQLLFFRRRLSLPGIPEIKVLAAFILFLLFNFALRHEYPWTSIRGFGKYLGGFLTLFAVIDVARDEKQFYRAFYLFLTVCGVVALAALWQKWAGADFIYCRSPYISQSQARLSGTFKHYNDFGTFLVPGVLSSLAFAVVSWKGRKKVFAFVGAFLFSALLYVLIHSFSRSAFIGAIFGLLLFLSFFKTRKWTLPIFALIVAVFLLFYSPLRGRMEEIFNLAVGSSSERLLLANISVKMIQQSPLIGLGMNTYSIYYPSFKPSDYAGLMYSHDSYLQMATEIGIAGVMLYLLYIAACAKWALRGFKADTAPEDKKILTLGFFSAVSGLLVNALFESLLQSTQLRTLFWTMMGFMLAASSLRRIKSF